MTLDPNHTDISLLLDCSGSMSPVRDSTIAAIDDFVASQKKLPGRCTFSLALFDTGYEALFTGVPIQEVPSISELYRIKESTALLDAMEQMITDTGKRLSAMNIRPGKVLFVVMTDGLENASQRVTHQQVRELVAHQQEVYSWEFLFLGANIDAIAVARALNIRDAANFASNNIGMGNSRRYLDVYVTSARVGNEDARKILRSAPTAEDSATLDAAENALNNTPPKQ